MQAANLAGFEVFTNIRDNADHKELIHQDREAFVRINKQSPYATSGVQTDKKVHATGEPSVKTRDAGVEIGR